LWQEFGFADRVKRRPVCAPALATSSCWRWQYYFVFLTGRNKRALSARERQVFKMSQIAMENKSHLTRLPFNSGDGVTRYCVEGAMQAVNLDKLNVFQSPSN
jgi:hypothetical protein